MSRPRPSATLAVLASGFVLSAVLRAGTVVAALPELAGDGFGNPVAREDAPAEPESAVVLIAELKDERARITEKEKALEERAQTLESIEARLRRRLDELSAAQQRLERMAVTVDDAAGRDVRHLAEMYQTMKPKQAAVIFDRMTPSFAAGFLGAMPSESAAMILAAMEADKAYAVSLLLASRNLDRPGPRP